MPRKGNRQRNGLDPNISNHTFKVPDSANVPSPKEKGTVDAQEETVVNKEEPPNTRYQCRSSSPLRERINKAKYSGDDKKNKLRSHSIPSKEKARVDRISDLESENAVGSEYPSGASYLDGEGEIPFDYAESSKNLNMAAEDAMNNPGCSDVVERGFGALALSVLEKAGEWLEKQKPLVSTLTAMLSDARDYIFHRTEAAYPIISRWLLHFGKVMLLLFTVWLDCCLRGLDSLLRLGTTSFFTVIWCSTLSIIAMIGILKFLIIMVTSGFASIFLGLPAAFLVTTIFVIAFLWMYGSFWITGFFVLAGGITYSLKHERLALLITTVYAVYCAKLYVGWLGLLLGINLAFISGDILIHFLTNNVNEQQANSIPEQSAYSGGRTGTFYGEPARSSPSEDQNPGIPSTSGAETELTSEDEVMQLLNCVDHYSALGLSRYANIDVSSLKREYRKKAMLVHPDKNMGNERAAEAFKKLQNAYEVLLDSLKRKAYDDELRREELLNCFRRFSASHRNGRHGFFGSGLAGSEADEVDPHGDSRRIVCKKCNNFHVWVHTNRSKSQARWCQDCKDFHQAKDGDGWVEQTFQPFLFGLLQKVDAPRAYVCAESRIYDATEWFLCQGMRCAPNTHKPSFHVNTSLTMKHNSAKGGGWSQRSGVPMPEEVTMTEEEFFEWLQNAVQSGLFEEGGGGSSSSTSESPGGRSGTSAKSNAKKRRKGKKQW